MTAADRNALPERSCGTCGLCCKLLAIRELDKPAGAWCSHWKAGIGCRIHGNHPTECREFFCEWMVNPGLGEDWKPTRSKMVLSVVRDGRLLLAYVDPGSPNQWREPRYHQALRRWARDGAPHGRHVAAKIGNRLVVILPDKDVDLGVLEMGEDVYIGPEMTARGPELVARKVAK